MVCDLADLRSRWSNLCAKCGIADEARGWELLDTGYNSSTRYYHNWSHISDCLALLDEFAGKAINPIAMELAIWFHDVIYDSTRSDNEEQSALLAEATLASHAAIKQIVAMIRATTHRESPADADTALLCDIDLSILGAEPTRYDAYARAIRREYEWVGAEGYRTGRAKVLQFFLNRPAIYTREVCQQRWEKTALLNLERELSSLSLP